MSRSRPVVGKRELPKVLSCSGLTSANGYGGGQNLSSLALPRSFAPPPTYLQNMPRYAPHDYNNAQDVRSLWRQLIRVVQQPLHFDDVGRPGVVPEIPFRTAHTTSISGTSRSAEANVPELQTSGKTRMEAKGMSTHPPSWKTELTTPGMVTNSSLTLPSVTATPVTATPTSSMCSSSTSTLKQDVQTSDEYSPAAAQKSLTSSCELETVSRSTKATESPQISQKASTSVPPGRSGTEQAKTNHTSKGDSKTTTINFPGRRKRNSRGLCKRQRMDSVIKRARANAREKQRVQGINDHYGELCRLVPYCHQAVRFGKPRRLPKDLILRKTSDYIDELELRYRAKLLEQASESSGGPVTSERGKVQSAFVRYKKTKKSRGVPAKSIEVPVTVMVDNPESVLQQEGSPAFEFPHSKTPLLLSACCSEGETSMAQHFPSSNSMPSLTALAASPRDGMSLLNDFGSTAQLNLELKPDPQYDFQSSFSGTSSVPTVQDQYDSVYSSPAEEMVLEVSS